MTQSVFESAYFAAYNTERIQKCRTFKKSIEKMWTKKTDNKKYFSTRKAIYLLISIKYQYALFRSQCY